MKFSWRDVVAALLVASGALLVFAKYQKYSWWLLGSWRGAVAAIGAVGLVMYLDEGLELRNRSWLNIGEWALSVVAIGLIVAGLIVSSEAIFISLASVFGALWLVATARHVRHSLVDSSTHYSATVR